MEGSPEATSRVYDVLVRLANNSKLPRNMSCCLVDSVITFESEHVHNHAAGNHKNRKVLALCKGEKG